MLKSEARLCRWIALALAGLVMMPSSPCHSADSVDYLAQVKSVLSKRCWSCHGALKQESELRLDTAELIRQGGAVVVGNSAESELVQRISSTDSSTRMPPEGPALSPSEIAAIKSWIDAGATSPADETPEVHPRDHWAFQLPRRPILPAAASWGRNPLDAFIDERRRAHGLVPVDEVDGDALLRRVTIDLTGLPPSSQELHHFEQQVSPDRYERLVDRLLASPSYGERWGRHWMDVWRYSDWYGRRSVPDVMNSYPQIWRWRDWIVDSLNADRPYDEMIVAMLAADEATPGDDREVVATGYLVRNWFKWNYENWMKDNVEHTAKAFLGITMNCCHCHDHKYDRSRRRNTFAFGRSSNRWNCVKIESRDCQIRGRSKSTSTPKRTARLRLA